jgi:hypothetical protein
MSSICRRRPATGARRSSAEDVIRDAGTADVVDPSWLGVLRVHQEPVRQTGSRAVRENLVDVLAGSLGLELDVRDDHRLPVRAEMREVGQHRDVAACVQGHPVLRRGSARQRGERFRERQPDEALEHPPHVDDEADTGARAGAAPALDREVPEDEPTELESPAVPLVQARRLPPRHRCSGGGRAHSGEAGRHVEQRVPRDGPQPRHREAEPAGREQDPVLGDVRVELVVAHPDGHGGAEVTRHLVGHAHPSPAQRLGVVHDPGALKHPLVQSADSGAGEGVDHGRQQFLRLIDAEILVPPARLVDVAEEEEQPRDGHLRPYVDLNRLAAVGQAQTADLLARSEPPAVLPDPANGYQSAVAQQLGGDRSPRAG